MAACVRFVMRVTPAAYEALMTNLGCHNLSTAVKCDFAHVALLACGTNFVPTPCTLSRQALQRETDRFVNMVRWRAVFNAAANDQRRVAGNAASPGTDRPQMPALYRPTGATAPPADNETELWITRFRANIDNLANTLLCVPGEPIARPTRRDSHLLRLNINLQQRAALRELRRATRFTRTETDADASAATYKPPRVVICNADKNLGLTIVDYTWFRAECLKQLGDRRFYCTVEPRRAVQLVAAAYKHLERLVFTGRRVRSPGVTVVKPDRLEPWQRFLLSRPPDHPQHRVPSFYVIPKVHKPRLVGRPITPAQHFCLSPACDLVTKMLHPLVVLVPEVLRDSTQLLLELEEPSTLNITPSDKDELYLVTGDVESLYTNIPRGLCLELLRALPIPAVVLDLLELIFDYCVVRFDEYYYQQIDGFPMGISPAPDVANLFMWLLVRRLPVPPQRRLFRRLIDDLFIVWVGTRDALEQHLGALNSLHPNIRITWTISRHSAAFLDLDIHLGERFYSGERRLDVRVHQKQLNRYLFIPAHSFHRTTQHRAWIKAELLRFLRNSSAANDLKRSRARLFRQLLVRGHRVAFLRRAFGSPYTLHPNRDSLLSAQQLRQDRAYGNMVQLVDKIVTPATLPTLYSVWSEWCSRDFPGLTRAPGTPWPLVENLLLDPVRVQHAQQRTVGDIFPLFTRDAPPTAFFIPLTSATAGLRWGDLSLTLPPPLRRESTGQRERVLVVHRRPPSLGAILRFRDPRHRPAVPRASPARPPART